MFTINFYQNTSETNRVDKTDYLTLIETINGNLKEESSIIDMVVTIEHNEVPNFNYVYIPIFNRYYYIVDIVSVRNNLWEISLSIDVLMTYKEGILNTICFVERSQSLTNNYLIDKKRVIEEGFDVEVLDVESEVFSDDIDSMDYCYILNGYKFRAIEDT